MRIQIIDQEQLYAAKLKEKLQIAFPEARILTFFSPPYHEPNLEDELQITLYTYEQYPDYQAPDPHICLHEALPFGILREGEPDIKLFRLGSLNLIITEIQNQIDKTKGYDQTTLLPISTFYCQNLQGAELDFICKKAREILGNGDIPIILELGPSLFFPPTTHPNSLSDLFRRVGAEEPNLNFGKYLEAWPCLPECLRLVPCNDEEMLLTLAPSLLRKTIIQLAGWITLTYHSHWHILVLTYALPMRLNYVLSSLSIELITLQDQLFRNQVQWERDVSLLAGQLPSGARHMNHQISNLNQTIENKFYE